MTKALLILLVAIVLLPARGMAQGEPALSERELTAVRSSSRAAAEDQGSLDAAIRELDLVSAARSQHHELYSALQAHDSGTAVHSLRMAALTAELYEVWAVGKGLAPDQIRSVKQQLFQGALLHDIGKLGTSRRILNSRVKGLPDYMLQEIKKHPENGQRALGADLKEVAPVSSEVAQYHHEKWNGKGYHGVEGEFIPLSARVAAICDVFEAVTGDRSYRSPMTKARALNVIKSGAGTAFDPELSRLFVEHFDTIDAAARLNLENTSYFGSAVSANLAAVKSRLEQVERCRAEVRRLEAAGSRGPLAQARAQQQAAIEGLQASVNEVLQGHVNAPATNLELTNEHVRLRTRLGRAGVTMMVGVGNQLLSLIIMQTCNQLFLDKKVDTQAILRALDSPDMFMALTLSALPGGSAAPPAQSLLKLLGGERAASLLGPMVGTVAGLVSFQLASTFCTEALEGLTTKKGPPTFSELLGDETLRSRYFRNLAFILKDPDKRRAMITTVFRDRIASLEFAATLAGMYAGSVVGLRVGAALGTGPLGSALMSAICGGFGAALAGNSCTAMVSAYEELRLPGAREKLRTLLATEETGAFEHDYALAKRLVDCLHEYEGERNAVVEKLFALYASNLGREMQAERQWEARAPGPISVHAEMAARSSISACRQMNEEYRAKLASLFEDELEMYDRLIEREGTAPGRRTSLVQFENETFLAYSMVQASMLTLRETLGPGEVPSLGGAERAPPEHVEAVGFQGLASH